MSVAAAIAVLWLPWVLHVSLEWRFNPQYGYAWSVPILAAYLAWENQYRASNLLKAVNKHQTPNWWLVVAGGCYLVIGLTRVLSIANPDWRLPGWILGLAAAAGTLSLLAYAYRPGIIRQFLFPILFMLVATPWPYALEHSIVLQVRELLTLSTVELASWCGVPARAVGNLIITAEGVIGVDEACSGIRSLQGSLMMALFLGAFFKLQWLWRVLLVVICVILSLVLNLLRSLILLLIADTQGLEAADYSHDPAGWTIFTILSLILLATAYWLPKSKADEQAAASGEWQSGSPGMEVPVAAVVAGLLALLVPSAWFAAQAPDPQDAAAHRVLNWPREAIDFEFSEPDEEVRRQLRYDWASQARWVGRDGSTWMLVDIHWDGGKASSFLALAHGPEVCLPAAGFELDSGPEQFAVSTATETVIFSHYRYRRKDETLDVFHLVSGTGPTGQTSNPWDRWHRVRLAYQGIKQQPTQVITLALRNRKGPSSAGLLAHDVLASLLESRPDSGKSD